MANFDLSGLRTLVQGLLLLAATDVATSAAADDWARALGGSNREWAVGVGADADGRVTVLGHFHGTTRPGGALGALDSAGDSDFYLVQWSAAGEALWARRFGGAGQDEGKGLAVGPDGTIYVTGFVSRSIELEPGWTLDGRGSADVVVLALDRDGALRWARRFGGPSGDVGYDVAVAPSGDVWVTGYFQDHIDFGDTDAGHLPPIHLESAGNTDTFVVRLGADGVVRGAWSFGGEAGDQGRALAIGADGEIALCGNFERTIADGTGGYWTSVGGSDVAIWRLDDAGAVRRADRFGGAGGDSCEALAIGDDGTLYAAGSFFGEASIGDLRLGSVGGTDVFTLALGRDGGVRWGRRFGQPSADFGFGVAALDDRVVVAGFSQLPRSTATASGEADGLVLHLGAADGATLEAVTLEGDPAIQALALAAAADGALYVTGMFRGGATIDVGGRVETLPGAGKFDVFLARLGRR